jgi:hypothetical protein
MKNSTLIAVVGLLLAGSVIGSAAFSVLTLERSANLNVETDSSGILTLTPGSSPIIETDGDGALAIDIANTGATGVNVDSVLEIGDNSSASAANTDPGFTVTNSDNIDHDISFDYTLDATDPDGTVENVNIYVYDGSTLVAEISEDTGSETVSAVTSSSVLDVVVVTDTRGLDGNTDDLSGTLEIIVT